MTIGEAQIVDASKPGEAKTVAAGDVIHVEKGTTVTWTATKKLKCKSPTAVISITQQFSVRLTWRYKCSL